MATLQSLINQKAELEKQIDEMKRAQRSEAISKVRELMDQFGLSVSDLQGRVVAASKNKGAGAKLAAKFRNAATGESWSGRGLQPKWLRQALSDGKSLDDFKV